MRQGPCGRGDLVRARPRLVRNGYSAACREVIVERRDQVPLAYLRLTQRHLGTRRVQPRASGGSKRKRTCLHTQHAHATGTHRHTHATQHTPAFRTLPSGHRRSSPPRRPIATRPCCSTGTACSPMRQPHCPCPGSAATDSARSCRAQLERRLRRGAPPHTRSERPSRSIALRCARRGSSDAARCY
jgi:hypothetical protein